MNFRLRTSKKTAEKLKELQDKIRMTPNILSRYAVVLSLRNPEPVVNFVKDTSGLEFNRTTLTGSYDFIFKSLIAQHSHREISDDEFFPDLFNAHLERGISILESEYEYAGNQEKMIINLMTKMPGVG
ncbi:DNA sulfur modification protein DndE [Paenibacillus sp. NRS-1760]|uniref:DNA sulfur modification protein DndE n=1 Tax=Paenibacillus sp. NRS-1760 TaxID=3233902 RepID=UPI003D26B37D